MKQAFKEKTHSFQVKRENYKRLSDDAPVALFECDDEGNFTYINKKLSELSGFSKQKALSLNLLDLVFEKDRAKVASELAISLNEKENFKSEFRIYKADESRLRVYGYANLILDKKGNVNGFSGAFMEIFQQKKIDEITSSEHKLFEIIKESERKLAEAQNVANLGSWDWNIEKYHITWSDQLYRIFEMEPGTEISLDTYFEKIHPEDHDFVKNEIFKAKEQKRTFNFQHRILVDDVTKYLDCRGKVILNNDKEPITMLGTAQDITEEQKDKAHEMEEKLKTFDFQSTLFDLSKTSSLSLKKIYENTTETDAKQIDSERVGIWLFNKDRTAIVCYCLYNKNTNKHSFDLMVLKKDAPNYFKALEENRILIMNDAINDPATSELSEFYLKPLGISSMLDAPIRAQGELLGVLCHEHVGSKRQWTNEEQNFASSVADIVAISIQSYNRKIADKKLKLLNEKLELANEHKRQFISVISHDLRNPISSIISASSFLVDHFDELAVPDAQRMLQIINNASKETLKHFDELIRIAKMEKQESLFYPEKLLLAKDVKEDIKLVLQIAEQKKIKLINRIRKDVNIKADKIMLKSILQNLLTNAIKYSFEGGEIEIFSETLINMERITVKDKGLGMSEEKQHKLFAVTGSYSSKKGTVGEEGT
nr:PAS domain-containing protein [Bacteroidota bacterium]